MSLRAKLFYKNKKIELPIINSVYGPDALDISKLESSMDLITLDIGYKNTGSTISEITYLNGSQGELFYRGYPIEQLANQATFVEVIYLLIFGELPTNKELITFENKIISYCSISKEIELILNHFPSSSHPMAVLSSLINALSAFNPNVINCNLSEDLNRLIFIILGNFMVLCTWIYRKKLGLPFNNVNSKFGYVENFHYMMFNVPFKKYIIDPIIINVLNKLFILHADHEQNCSTTAVRIVGSSHVGLFSSISSGISALWGALHGGANEEVIKMLELIKNDGNNLEKWIEKAKDKNNSFRLMGFGHRVYKNFDPRAKIIRKACDDILNKLNINDPILNIAKKLEELALNDSYFIERNLYPNVDFYSGIIYKSLGIPLDMFTVMFALGRLPGWIAQWIEMRQNQEPISRPRQVYIGKLSRDFIPISLRKH